MPGSIYELLEINICFYDNLGNYYNFTEVDFSYAYHYIIGSGVGEGEFLQCHCFKLSFVVSTLYVRIHVNEQYKKLPKLFSHFLV